MTGLAGLALYFTNDGEWVRKAAAALLNRRLSHLSYKDQGAALWQVELSHRLFHDIKNKITCKLGLVSESSL